MSTTCISAFLDLPRTPLSPSPWRHIVDSVSQWTSGMTIASGVNKEVRSPPRAAFGVVGLTVPPLTTKPQVPLPPADSSTQYSHPTCNYHPYARRLSYCFRDGPRTQDRVARHLREAEAERGQQDLLRLRSEESHLEQCALWHLPVSGLFLESPELGRAHFFCQEYEFGS